MQLFGTTKGLARLRQPLCTSRMLDCAWTRLQDQNQNPFLFRSGRLASDSWHLFNCLLDFLVGVRTDMTLL